MVEFSRHSFQASGNLANSGRIYLNACDFGSYHVVKHTSGQIPPSTSISQQKACQISLSIFFFNFHIFKTKSTIRTDGGNRKYFRRIDIIESSKLDGHIMITMAYKVKKELEGACMNSRRVTKKRSRGPALILEIGAINKASRIYQQLTVHQSQAQQTFLLRGAAGTHGP